MKEYICKEEPVYDLDCNITDYALSIITELVRCKDCKYHDYGRCGNWDYCKTEDVYFCKDGERKEE